MLEDQSYSGLSILAFPAVHKINDNLKINMYETLYVWTLHEISTKK